MNKKYYTLKYQRNEYGKQVRKAYKTNCLKERRYNMREHSIRTDGLSNTITTVQKDNYILEIFID